MPSSSEKQKNFMAAVANNPAFAKKAGVPQSVGQEFVEADKRKAMGTRADLQSVNKPKTNQGSQELFSRYSPTHSLRPVIPIVMLFCCF